uniref:Cyclin-A2 n=1 Tax=Aceria tosichella TaxID=561515 RepID=A0A6G1SID3_9ACAR
MTSKFKIFCDEPQTTEIDLPTKREPLATKQHFVQRRPQLKLQEHHHQQQTHSQASSQESVVPQPPLSTHSSSPSEHDQDQENDISIASLGSDFVPSILHEHFDSFECEEEEANMTATSMNTESECHHDEFAIDSYSDDQRISLGDLEDDDIDLDEETQLELSLALKKHDESALLKCAVFNHDIMDYLHALELDPDSRPIPNYMAFHEDIDSNKRSILINWLVEVTDEYELQTETLFICTNIVDRFLSKMSISTSHFQLLGVAAMFIATKYEEIYPPYLSQFVEVTDETFSGKQIIQMEQEILRTLDFRISMPTTTFFLRQIFAYNKFTKKVYNLAEYLCYLSLLADQPFLEYYPSEIALAAVILAAHQLSAAENISSELKSSYDKSNQSQVNRRGASPSSSNTLNKRTSNRVSGHREHTVNNGLPFCIESLRAMQERVPRDSAVYLKFSSTAHDRVALLPPLSVEDLQQCA